MVYSMFKAPEKDTDVPDIIGKAAVRAQLLSFLDKKLFNPLLVAVSPAIGYLCVDY